jgi:hypothetical protein
MKLFNNIQDYKKEAKKGDLIILDIFCVNFDFPLRNDIYTIYDPEKFYFKAYRSRKLITINIDHRIKLLTKKEFKSLEIW